MKKILAFFLCLSVFIASGIDAVAFAGDTLTVKAGIYENSPKIFTDDKGNASGFWPDILGYIASQEGWKIEWVHGTWTECLEKLGRGEIDIMPDVAYSEARDALYDFSHETVHVSWSMVYAIPGSGIQSIPDLEGKNIAVLKGSINVEGPDGIKQLAMAFNVNCTFIETDSYIKVFELMNNKQADAGVVSKDFGHLHEADYQIMPTAIVFQPALLYFAFPPQSTLKPYLIEKIDYHMKILKGEANSFYFQALAEWFGIKPIEEPVFPAWAKWLLIGIGGLAFLLASGSLLLRFQIKRKTKELAEDVAERKRVEKRLRDSISNFDKVINDSADAIIIASSEGTVYFVNPAAEILFGRKKADFQGKSFGFPVTSGETIEIEIIRKAGETVTAEMRVVETVWNDEIAYLATLRDVTERKKAQQAQERLSQALKAKVSELETFSYGIAHDLKSPLISIEGFTRLLKEDLQNNNAENVKEDIRLLESGVRKMQGFIQSTLEYSRAGRLIKRAPDVSFSEIVNEALTDYNDQLNAIGAAVSRAKSFPKVNVDRSMIVQVLANLIQNSIKYRDASISLQIEIGHESQNGEPVFFVRDNGMGISADEVDKVFEIFYRGTSHVEGSGIGLKIVKKIIEAHGGKIWVQNGQAHQGTTICFTLPEPNADKRKTNEKD